jgi:four helix bundle protein
MQRFSDLRAWKASHALALSIYRVTSDFPAHEKYGLTSQLRRSAVSIPANLAEGSKRQMRTDYARFINLAEGSAAEARSLLLLSRDLGYAPSETVEPLLVSLAEIAGMLHRLRLAVESADRAVRRRTAASNP